MISPDPSDWDLVRVSRSADGWSVNIIQDGEPHFVFRGIDDEAFRGLFWDDLYFDLIDYKIPWEKEYETAA